MSGRAKPHEDETKTTDPTTLPILPPQWGWASLSELAAKQPNSITDGPFGSNLKSSHYTKAGPRVIRLQNIGDGVFRDEYAHISESHFESLKRHEVVTGDIAIAALGETLPRSCVIPPWVGPAIVKADCPRFRPNRQLVLSEFVNFALNSPDTRKRASQIIHGVGRPRLNLAEIRCIWIPVAPLNEQHRIVAKIEELFSDLDAGVAALERARANLKRYRAAVLKAAVEGKLTEQWRADHPDAEPASQFLQRILTERRQKWEADQLAKYAAANKTPPKNWRDKYPEPTPPDTTSLPELPKGWCWASVDQTSEVQGGIQKQPKRAPNANSFPFLRVANVHRNRLELDEIHRIELFGDELERLRLQPDDLLVVEGNGSKTEIGRSAIWKGEIEDCVHQNHIIRVRFLAGQSRYLNAYWNSPSGNGRVMEQAASTSGLYTLSVTKVCSLPVPLSPVNEQRQIVAEVEERLSEIAAAETAIQHGLLRAARLRQSILKQAFEGKLVPQDPTDEPASVLLDRIRVGGGDQISDSPSRAGGTSPRERRSRSKSGRADS